MTFILFVSGFLIGLYLLKKIFNNKSAENKG